MGIEIARNNSWRHYDQSSHIVFVFVHGYFSSSEICWRSKNQAFWPDLILTDKRIPACSIYLGGYFTGISSGAYGARDCVDELFSALGRLDIEGRRTPLSFPTIAFVCHSLGGIVVREMLATHSDKFKGKKVGLALIASPSLGSDYASNFLSIAKFYRNRIGKQLAFGSAYLEDLDRRFIKYLEEHPRDDFIGAEAIELHSPFYSKFLPDFSPIVPSQSAGRYFSNRQKISENHSGIVKPTDINHPSHNFFVDFVSRLTKERTENPTHQAFTIIRQPRSTDVLFDIYQQAFEPHYVERDLDLSISRIAEIQSIWLSGNSGLGKSCSIMRHIGKSRHRIDICLSQCGDNASKESVLKEIRDTLGQCNYSACNSSNIDLFQQVVSALSSLSEFDDACIFIDEVPSGPTSCTCNNLLSVLADLITSLKQRHPRTPRFFICSLVKPKGIMASNPAKLGEHLGFVNADSWTDEDLGRLYKKIISALPSLAQSDFALQQLISSSRGSPRFFKAYFRTAYNHANIANLPDEILRLTRQQLSMEN